MIRIIEIESKSNPRIKEYRKLMDKKERRIKGLFLAEGFRMVQEAFKAGMDVKAVVYDSREGEQLQRYLGSYLNSESLELIASNPEVIRQLSSTETPQGIVAVIADARMVPESTGLIIYLDRLQDPGNVGTIIRSAHAGGASRVILGKGSADPYSEKAMRSSMGSIFHIPVTLDGDEELERLAAEGIPLAVTSLEASRSIYSADLTGDMILVIGNEGNGVRQELMDRATILLRIPMPGNAESLNASIAASVIIFERVRQLEESEKT